MAAAQIENLTPTQAVLIAVGMSKHPVPLKDWSIIMGGMGINGSDQLRLNKIDDGKLKVLETLVIWREQSSGNTLEKLIAILLSLKFKELARALKERKEWKFPTSTDDKNLVGEAAFDITSIIMEHMVALRGWSLLIYCLELELPNQFDLENEHIFQKVLDTIKAWIAGGDDQDCRSLGKLTAIFRLVGLNNLADKLDRTPDTEKMKWTGMHSYISGEPNSGSTKSDVGKNDITGIPEKGTLQFMDED